MANEYWVYNRNERKWVSGPHPSSQAASDYARRASGRAGETSVKNSPTQKVTFDVVTTTAP